MNQLRIFREILEKDTAYYGGIETFLWNRCSYQDTLMVGTNVYKNDKRKFYNAMAQGISQGGGYYDTKVGVLCG